ncbi:Tc toxin subunit A-related protein [Membranihabitans marinus]|uniref:Tc toxin subunit A-related protein n=1 Tax=Membranihabitans marinus TaxID=1227546 RepID=UPI001F446D08|nr:neuraminidase-like domain-containing protein [Membranihabitans marinus]
MNKQELLQLEKLSNLKPVDIEKQNTALFRKLNDTASLKLKTKIEEKLKDAHPEIIAGLKRVDFSATNLGKLDVKSVLSKNLLSGRLTAEKKKELESVVSKIPDLGNIDNVLLPDVPVFINPLFHKDIQKAKLHRLNITAGISDAKLDKVYSKNINLNNLEEEKLDSLVQDKTITKKEAEKLALASSLHNILDGSFELSEEVHKNIKLSSLSDLAKITKAEWKKWIESSKTVLADGISSDDYADFLNKKIETLFPEISLTYHSSLIKTPEVQESIKTIKPLIDKNNNLFGLDSFDQLDTTGLSISEVKKVKIEYEKLHRMVKTNPGLQIDEILNDKNIKIDDKAKVIKDRTDLIDKFIKQNENINFLSLEYKHDSDDLRLLNLNGFTATEKTMVLNYIKAQQRVYSFTQDVEDSQKIMEAGYHSSYHVTSVTLNEFITSTKLDKTKATLYFENAHMAIIRTTGMMGSILDILTGSFDWTRVGNTGPTIEDYLREIPGYQDLFGQLAFCDCQHCQSIYSPAAYFVDLMQFVERYVIDKHFTGVKSNHVLNLKTRRPDLWTLELTCENTTTLIPYLTVINEILESYIAQKKGYAGDLNDRASVENFVYKQEIALEKPGPWKNNLHSFQQPFHLPLVSVQTYLGHFEKSREDIANLLKQNQLNISRAKFNLSDKDFHLITTTDISPAFIQRVYGLNFTVVGGKIKPFNAQNLLKSTGSDRKELGLLLKTLFITNNGSDNIVIQSEKKSPESIQNDIERIKNLTYSSLDRLHRFVRLRSVTNLTIGELDLLIGMVRNIGIANDINPDAVETLGQWIRLKEKLNIGVEELASIVHLLPEISIKEDIRPFMDRLFNHEDVIVTEGLYPKAAVRLIHPALAIDQSTVNAEFSASRLSSAFNRSDDEILTLINQLAQPLGIVSLNSVTESERGFLLTKENLSLLFRHHAIAESVNLPLTDFFRFILLSPEFPNGYLENFNQITKFLELHTWWKTSTYSLDDLHLILKTGNVVDSSRYISSDEVSKEIIQTISEGNQMLFADTVFSFLDDITEDQSKEIISQNINVIELSPDGTNYWLKKEFNPNSAINLPVGISLAEIDLRKVLISYHSQHLIPFHLSGKLNLTENAIVKLAEAISYDLNNDALTLELQNNTDPSVALKSLIDELVPISILLKDKKYNDEAIVYIADNLPSLGIGDIKSLNLQNIRSLHSYSSFIKTTDDGSNNVADLSTVINGYSAVNQYQNVDQKLLAQQLEIEENTLLGIHPLAVGFTHAIPALNFYRNISTVCQYIGIGGSTLTKIISTDYDILTEANLEILAAFRSKYKDEEERKEKLEKYQDSLLGKKRASLTNYLIHSGFPQFENTNDLYHYFLIDTEMEGCSRTSRLVAATMSLQLYIHRILLNLEQDGQEPGTVGRIYVQPDDIPSDEWVWRKNYRVWEANRKVFLYPENYIEPDLRDNKTPLFKELESELLQKEINADNVLDAYAKYMRGFDEVAHLKIAGSFHEKDEESATDVLHLFGVTADEPPMYYYRTVENLYYSEKRDDRGLVWEPWQKINVQIPVRKVAPITYNGRLHVFWTRITSLANTVFDNNRSIFTGYSHKVSIEFTTLKLDGTWTPPQKLNLKECYPYEGNGVIQDPLADRYEIDDFTGSLHDALRSFPFFDFSSVNDAIREMKKPRYALSTHYEPVDEYTLQGFLWDQVYPYVDSSGRLIITGAGYQMRAAIDFYNLNIQNNGIQISSFTNDPVQETWHFVKDKVAKRIEKSGNSLYRASAPSIQLFDNYAYGALITNTSKSNTLLKRLWSTSTLDYSFDHISQNKLATVASGSLIQTINGGFSDAIIDVNGDLLLLQGGPVDGNGFILKRLGTTLSETLTRTLFTSGVDTALNIATQKALKELNAPINLPPGSGVENKVITQKIDWKGGYGIYYREIFFQIPFLLANHLNSQGKYADAQKWYHYIFNPGANEIITFPAGATPAQKKKMELDRNWQYLEFREIDAQTLREQLNDKTAIEAYKKDPFNPHAIARLRMSAYQKCIVMKYIDNLLDWGDQLFTRDTMESINEASLLYMIAKEILGDRPIEIGDCGEGKISPKNYANIQPLLDKGSEFLAELETYTIVRTPSKPVFRGSKILKAKSEIIAASNKALSRYSTSKSTAMKSMTYDVTMKEFQELKGLRKELLPSVTARAIDDRFTGAFSKGVNRTVGWKKDSIYVRNRYKIPSFGISIIRQVSPVFCVPGNTDLLDYYNRVDDRMYKIRNCMNILGQRRQLALFAPVIDPRLLVRAAAAGLSLDDVLNATSGNLPPYRFAYILERAKAFTSVVQSFGASLLNAMEKRDGDELSLIRMTQQQNLLEMTTRSRELEIKSAEEGIKVLNDRIESLDYQIGYYEGLIAENRSGWEIAQSVGRHTSSIISGVALPLWSLTGVFGLIPQVGSPFAMKYGGVELKGGSEGFAKAVDTGAAVSEALAASSGLEAGFDRRSTGWSHQKKTLEFEKKQTEKNLIAAEIRRDILIEGLMSHQKNVEHNQEVIDYYGTKFSNLGLYTWLSSTMQRLYKESYNNALAIARLAEQAFRYERDANTFFITDSYFDGTRGGLLAGEQLLMALQNMERSYLETNYRKNEIDQAFSLTQIDPGALLTLKQIGTCNFSIPEIYFDMFYPGQYRRKIQSVRLTIPCVTGPFTNVGATLSMTSSQIRMEAKLGNAELKDVPKSRTTVIATSTAQNDAGVFQLNFRDDRYMPFEGGGAVSSWKLDLPKSFKQFDYQTINDIIIHISYTADYDELFRDKVEEQNDAVEGTLVNILKNNPMSRSISLRQEFSTDFHRLTELVINTDILIKIQNKHFPLFLNGKPLSITKASLILVNPTGQTVNGFRISINGVEQNGFIKDAAFGNLYAKDLGNLFNAGIIKDHTIRVIASGDLAVNNPPPGPIPALDTEKLLDVVLYIEYKLA